MKILSRTLLFILICCVTPVLAEMTMILPEDITTVATNGKNSNSRETIVLPDGVNQIALRFEGEFGRHNDSEIEYSDVFVVKFSAIKERLQLKTPDIKNEYHLKKFNENPDIHILNASGDAIRIHISKLEKEGLQFMRDYEQELVAFNKTTSPAAVSSEAVSVKKHRQRTDRTDKKQLQGTDQFKIGDKDLSNPAEKMLKYWYRQADDQTRKAFREWLNSNSF